MSQQSEQANVKINDAQLAGKAFEYSKEMDEKDSLELEMLPYPKAYELMVGTNKTDPLWERIRHDNPLTQEEYEIATSVVENYPSPTSLPEFKEKQQNYAKLFEVDIRFDKFDVRFAKDLLNKINDGRLLSKEQFKRVKYFVYRYREQLRDKIIYEEQGPEELWDYLGDDPRQGFNGIVEECEEAHNEVNNRYE